MDVRRGERKNRQNRIKQVSGLQKPGPFFEDSRALLAASDPDHSEGEEGFLLLGMSSHARIPMVVHCYREKTGPFD